MAEDEDKEFDPTQRKLDEARQKGDVPRSADLVTAAAQAGLLLVCAALGSQAMHQLGTRLEAPLAAAPRYVRVMFGGGEQAFLGGFLVSLAAPLAPWFAVPAALAIVALIAQQGFAVSGEKLMPKLSRLNPLENAKNKFGRDGLFEFAKSGAKLTVISICLGVFLVNRMPLLIASAALPERAGLVLMAETLVDFILLSVVVAGIIGLIDLMWQRFSHRQKLRMSRKEVMDEHKQNEGDPHMKQQRRQRGYDIATNRMLQDVPSADVVIVNPQHYAVALRWDRLPGRAPICVAKGVDEIAARIRERAQAAGVPIHRDPPTSRAIYATTEIGAQIAPEHYRTVAAAIRFAEQIRARARGRKGP